MKRIAATLIAVAALGLISSGTASAEPANSVVPAVSSTESGIQAVWSTWGWTTSESACHDWGKGLVSDGLVKAYACSNEPENSPYGAERPWRLRVLD
jgi:hypothetical protein